MKAQYHPQAARTNCVHKGHERDNNASSVGDREGPTGGKLPAIAQVRQRDRRGRVKRSLTAFNNSNQKNKVSTAVVPGRNHTNIQPTLTSTSPLFLTQVLTGTCVPCHTLLRFALVSAFLAPLWDPLTRKTCRVCEANVDDRRVGIRTLVRRQG